MLTFLRNFLAMRDQSDVGPLSCRVTLKPVSDPLQTNIRLFRPPNLAQLSTFLADRLLDESRSRTRFPCSSRGGCAGLGARFRPEDVTTTTAQERRASPYLQYLLVKAHKPLPPFSCYDLRREFNYFHHTSYLALTRLAVARRMFISRFASRT